MSRKQTDTSKEKDQRIQDRRSFIKGTAAGAALVAVSPAISLAQQDSDAHAAPAVRTESRTDSEVLVGNDEHRFEVNHDFLKLPDQFNWQVTHNVAVDKSGRIYVIHEGFGDQLDHPSIFVFDANGTYVDSFGSELQGGGHGLEIREEDGEEFIYASAYQSLKFITKMSLTGERVWLKRAPMQTGLFAENEDKEPTGQWGRDRYMPTNFAFPDDGGFLVADGYGSYSIQRYDSDGNFVSHFGKEGDQDGQFNLPHGIWIDDRENETGENLIVVADRANNRLQWFKLDGSHVRTQNNFLLPANVDVREDLMLVPELKAQITLLGIDNSVVAVLGQDEDWREQVLADNFAFRRQPDTWRDGRFLHPHDACFDAAGNIIVAEWVHGGRVTHLKRV